MSDLAMESLQNLKLVEAARDEATAIIRNDALEEYGPMYNRFCTVQEQVYME
jgi:hypothetical protein